MVKINEKIKASLMLASYLETVGFKNGAWEFNYKIPTNDIIKYTRVWTIMLHHFLILGGTSKYSNDSRTF